MSTKELVERLQTWGAPTKQRAKPLMREAAAEIERLERKRDAFAAAEAEAATLRARVERLGKALVQIAGLSASAPSSDAHTRLHKALDTLDTARDCARAALTEEQP